MADIFLSYKRTDLDRVAAIVGFLEALGWSVWWDTRVGAGEIWDEVIERELEASRCVVVVWSIASVASRWVRSEASEGLERGILIPVHIDAVKPPLEFKLVHSIDLTEWRGSASSWKHQLRDALINLLGEPPLLLSEPVDVLEKRADLPEVLQHGAGRLQVDSPSRTEGLWSSRTRAIHSTRAILVGLSAGLLVVVPSALWLSGWLGPQTKGTLAGRELSDKSVLAIVRYAWALVPHTFTTPQGKVIEVDKSKPSESVVPMDTAREVIRVARMSAYAQICELPEEEGANYQALMRRQAEKKWTDQQMLYINQLHLFTVMTLTGKVQLVEKDGDKQVVVQEGKPVKTESCTDTERKKVQAQIMAHVSSTPPPATKPAAPAQAKAQPTPTSQKK